MSHENQTHWLRAIESDGYCIIPGLLSRETVCQLDDDLAEAFANAPMGKGNFYGYRTQRFGSLLRRSHRAAELVMQPLILKLARAILEPACERIQLNVAQAIAIHPGEIEQFPHCDHDMWPGPKGSHEYLLNVMWPLTEFTLLNGATRIYPGTHRQEISSLDELGEPIVAECRPGDAVCFLGSTVHGAGPNVSRDVRRGIVIGYSLGWLKPYENLWLAYPPEIARTFSTELAELAGYTQHRPNLGNYEGQCPSILLRNQHPDFLQATDALRPDQECAVKEFADVRRSGPMSPAHVLEPTYRRLKRELMDGTWPMGAKLEALRLADEFGVSATPVRDSLNLLVGEGLVDLTPGEGFRVTILSEQSLRDILRVNLLLLSGAIDGAWSRRTNESEGAPDDYADQLAGVFAALASGSGNQFLVRQIVQISERLHRVRKCELVVMHEAALHLAALQRSLDGDASERREALVRYHEDSLGHIAQLIAHIVR